MLPVMEYSNGPLGDANIATDINNTMAKAKDYNSNLVYTALC